MPRKPDSPAVAVLKKEIESWKTEKSECRRESPGWHHAAGVINALNTVLRDIRAAERSQVDGDEGIG